MSDAAMILLAPGDNVVVARRNVAAGEAVAVEGGAIIARADLPLGHKMARCAITTGEIVVKYGMAIGVATADIEAGDWVHLHNMKSSYISSHTRSSRVAP